MQLHLPGVSCSAVGFSTSTDNLRGRIVLVLVLPLPNFTKMPSGRQRIKRVLLGGGKVPSLSSSLNSSSSMAQKEGNGNSWVALGAELGQSDNQVSLLTQDQVKK